MFRKLLTFAVLACLTTGGALADFSYDETSRITGGAMAAMMKLAGAFSKQAREPMRSTVLVKGNRMARLSGQTAHIIDLDQETMTDIDFQKKIYSVITFAQMKEAMEKLAAQAQGQGAAERPDVEFKVSVKETGQTRQISGFPTREMLLTFEMEGADPKSGDKSSLQVAANLWVAPAVAGYDEVKAFYRRMAEKMAWTPGGAFASMGQPGVAKGMAQVAKEAAKLDGITMFQVTRISGKGEGVPQGGEQSQQQQAPQPPEVGKAAEDAAAGAATDAVSGRLGRFGGLGGLGGLGRRRPKEEKPKEEAPKAQASAPAASAEPGALMVMETEVSSLSSAPVDSSRLEPPAGFKQVEHEMVKMLRK